MAASAYDKAMITFNMILQIFLFLKVRSQWLQEKYVKRVNCKESALPIAGTEWQHLLACSDSVQRYEDKSGLAHNKSTIEAQCGEKEKQ